MLLSVSLVEDIVPSKLRHPLANPQVYVLGSD
jgi:hypothetical protein